MLATTQNAPEFERIFTEEEAYLNAFKESFANVDTLANFTHEPKQKTLFYVKDGSLLKKIPKSENYFIFLFGEMNCMLSGVCSRCLKQNKDGTFFYSCSKNILPM